jgi:hypothetical protein
MLNHTTYFFTQNMILFFERLDHMHNKIKYFLFYFEMRKCFRIFLDFDEK